MQFALVNNERIEANPGLKASCPGCLQPVTAKCGEQRIWHWAHSAKRTCDKWSEPETKWHRDWKNNFSFDWQECRMQDQSSGEWHIADVRANHGLVIEFQHSALKPEERRARENFYRNMIWVVNGARLKTMYPRFVEGKKLVGRVVEGEAFLLPYPEDCLPRNWLNSPVPIVFDFQDVKIDSPQDNTHEFLWWLLPGMVANKVVMQAMSRKVFVELTHTHSDLLQQAHKTVNTFLINHQIMLNNQRSIEMAHLQRYYQRGRRFRRF